MSNRQYKAPNRSDLREKAKTSRIQDSRSQKETSKQIGSLTQREAADEFHQQIGGLRQEQLEIEQKLAK